MNTRSMMVGMGLAALGLSACGTGGKKLNGQQTLVFSTPEKSPKWVREGKAFYEENDRFFYSAAVNARMDMALGMREARAEAEKNLSEEIKQLIRTKLGSSVEGVNTDHGLGSHVLDLIAKVSENVQVSGAKLTSQFVQKFEERTPFGLHYVWDCYAQVSITKEDYLIARRDVFNGAVAKAREEKNIKAEMALTEAFRKLEAVPPTIVVEEKR